MAMEHVESYDLLKDVHKAVEELFKLDDIMSFYYYFDVESYKWILIYNTKEDE